MIRVKMNSLLSKLPQNSRKWSYYDLQYVVIATIMTFNFIIIKSALPLKLLMATALISSFFIPYIRRFTVPALPIFTWLITFFACQFIPIDYRPTHIFVNLLPTLERILYGANLSEMISKHTHPVLDVLTWLPYGVIHFSFPFVLSALIFVYGPPGSLKVFGKAFGYMNLAGVLTQLLFPNASPWYEMIYGSAPADYSIPGEAGGLSRIDEILGLDLYGTTFGTSPLVFGAFPSLHSGCATIEMLFVGWLFPKMKPIAVGYVMWMWFSTMYLTHHYMIDLVGGSIYAILAFVVAQKFLPRVNPDARTRLEYLGVTKLSIGSFFYSIEHDPRDTCCYNTLPITNNDDVMKEVGKERESNSHPIISTLISAALQRHINNRPEPLRISEINSTRIEDEESSMSSPALSTGCWSPTSELDSPITPHSPTLHHHDFSTKPE